MNKIEAYAKQAKESWGETPEYKEYEEKSRNRTPAEQEELGNQLMAIIAEFGTMKDQSASARAVQEQVRKLQAFITDHYYTCTDETLSGLGKLYAAGGDFTQNIDSAGGAGTAAFTNEAIQVYCGK